MKRKIAIGDVHGRLDLLKDLIENIIRFNPQNDLLILLGDYIDRGPDSYGVILYLQALKQKYPSSVILLKGNHEDMVYLTISPGFNFNNMFHRMWMNNGGPATMRSFPEEFSTNDISDFLESFIDTLELYHEDENFIFVHAGVPQGKLVTEASEESLLWSRDFSYDGPKTVIVGHTIHKTVKKFKKTICIDTGSFDTDILTGYDVLNDKIYSTWIRKVY